MKNVIREIGFLYLNSVALIREFVANSFIFLNAYIFTYLC
ncbi:hypothetical protein SAMN05444366_4370 [Flavobacterium saccharophilum]|uniref:Uncharacterized protein n=1 Tax=Flavobacterium saccharophilum TaxID=29534 RepID=A0A1M7M5X2_9FLAO|nr:hypothetical protein SAMN05444366_4370 [Flavobacterium saccharophilum]